MKRRILKKFKKPLHFKGFFSIIIEREFLRRKNNLDDAALCMVAVIPEIRARK